MKISEIQAIEIEQINLLRQRSAEGDNEASQVLLEHLRAVSKDIDEWKRRMDAQDGGKGRKKRQYQLDPNRTNGGASVQ